VPGTILRTTQFHEFVLGILRALKRLPVMPVPRRFPLQPMEIGEVSERLVELALADPAGRVPDVGGPEVLTMAELARAFLGATGRSRRVLEASLPGKFFRAAREGAMVRPAPKGRTARSAGKTSSAKGSGRRGRTDPRPLRTSVFAPLVFAAIVLEKRLVEAALVTWLA
jgi:uncharacterized protein YbjT (DUF2867 family)